MASASASPVPGRPARQTCGSTRRSTSTSASPTRRSPPLSGCVPAALPSGGHRRRAARVRNDAVALVKRRARNFSHADGRSHRRDRQVLQVVGEIAADAFAAEAIVLTAADAIEEAADSVVDGARRRRPPRPRSSRPPRRRSRSTLLLRDRERSCSTPAAPRRRRRSTTSTGTGATSGPPRRTTRRS